MSVPSATFLLPIGGQPEFLEATLRSISQQTRTDWHVVAVLDGSQPVAERILFDVIEGSRVTCVRHHRRRGVAAALNSGLQAVRTPLVARIDADDVASPYRLERQICAMRDWEDVVAIGSAARLISASGCELGSLAPAIGRDVRRALLARNELVHPSVMFRTAAVRAIGGYSEDCLHREDYEMWLRLGLLGKIANLDERLVSYRLSAGQISLSRAPMRSHLEVFRARLALSRHLDASLIGSSYSQVRWSIGQTRFVQNRFGRLRGLRHGLGVRDAQKHDST